MDINVVNNEFIHKPVLLKQVLSHIAIYNNGVYLDGTVGLGGHAEEILKNTGPESKVIGIDRDEDALEICRKRLKKYGNRVSLIHSGFSNLRNAIISAGFERVNGILLDLGVSSLQLDNTQRGFSFQRNGPLDMRMDKSTGEKAEDLIHGLSEQELKKILMLNAQEKFAGPIARAIVAERKKKKISNTLELAGIIEKTVPLRFRKRGLHPATKTFQALRMEVNQEMEQLKQALNQVAESLIEKGRVAVISFHSGEDRLVKDYIFNQSRGCVCPPELPLCVCKKEPIFKRITKKPIRPDEKEIQANPCARSAKMRVAEKVA